MKLVLKYVGATAVFLSMQALTVIGAIGVLHLTDFPSAVAYLLVLSAVNAVTYYWNLYG